MWTSISQSIQMTAVVQYVHVGPRHATTMGWQVGRGHSPSKHAMALRHRGAGSDHPTSCRSTNKYRSLSNQGSSFKTN